MQGVAGDSDGDGDPSTTSFCNAGYDLNNLDMGETVGISIDTNNDGTYDLYLGWAKTPATTTFGVYGISGGPCNTGLGMASSCLTLLSVPGVSTAAFADPPTFPAPDPEFSITGFSLLTNPAIQMDFYAWSDHPIGGEDNAQILNQALPVQLLSFKAHEKDNDVVLNWETATEINNQGFYPQVSFDGVEFADLKLEEGLTPREAIIEAGRTRMTPVLLTAISTISGLIPLAVGLNMDFALLFETGNPHIYFGGDNVAFWGPLSWTMIFGLAFATIITLIIVPVLLLMAFNRKRKVLNALGKEGAKI